MQVYHRRRLYILWCKFIVLQIMVVAEAVVATICLCGDGSQNCWKVGSMVWALYPEGWWNRVELLAW